MSAEPINIQITNIETVTPIPAEYSEKVFTCDGCQNTALTGWSKKGPKGHLCQRCYMKTDGYSVIPREGEL